MSNHEYYEINYREFSANYIYDSHMHVEYEVNYICSGRCIINVQDQNITLKAGECIVIPSQYIHNFMVEGKKPCQIMQFIFSPDKVETMYRSLPLFQDCRKFFKISNCLDVLGQLQWLYSNKSIKSSSEYYEILYNLSIQRLFVLLTIHMERLTKIQKHYEYSIINPVIEHIETNYDQPICLESLAKSQKVSARYLRKLFIQQVGFCASDYITMLRLEKAKDLLKNSRKSISEIALEAGYNSFQYFSMTFKKKLGLSPSDFRKQYQK